MTKSADPASPSGALPPLLALQTAALLIRTATLLLVSAAGALPPEADATADAALIRACDAALAATPRLWRAQLASRHLRPGLARTRRVQAELYHAESEYELQVATVSMLWAWTQAGLARKAAVLSALLEAGEGSREAVHLRRVAHSLIADIQRTAWTGYGRHA